MVPARSTMLHEMQHAVQTKEEFARGGNPDSFNPEEAKTVARAVSWRREMERHPEHWTPAQKEAAVMDEYRGMGAEDWIPDEKSRALAADYETNPTPDLEKIIK